MIMLIIHDYKSFKNTYSSTKSVKMKNDFLKDLKRKKINRNKFIF